MLKLGTKRSDFECAKIGLMTMAGVKYENMGYCDDLCCYQAGESIFKAKRIAAHMPKEQGEQLVNFVIESNKKMEEQNND